MIVPTSTGHVFVSDENSMRNDNPPIQKLEDDHIFVPFVKEFWHKITTPGAGDLLMNAYAMLLFGIDTVPDACQQYIGTQLRQTPPDIVLIKDLNPLLHGFHQRTPNVWPYISIDKALVDRWADCMGRCPNERQTLALEALLKMILVHEGGHWHYTLARRPSYLIWNESSQPFSMQRVGSYTNEMMHLRNGLPAEQQEEIVNKCIPKSISVPWNPNKGESGNFSEYKGLGGMMGFDSRSETSTLEFFDCFREKSILTFFSYQYSCARVLAPFTFCRRIISSPFEKGAFVSFTRKRQRICLNPSQKLHPSGVRYKLIFSHQRTCHSGQIPTMFARLRHPTDYQNLSVSVSI